MKINFKTLSTVILATGFSINSMAQIITPCSPGGQNPLANPQITTANPNVTMTVVNGQTNLIEFRFANAGDDPIPTNTMFIDISFASDENFELVAPYLNAASAGQWTVDLTHTATDAVRLVNTGGPVPDGTGNDLQLIVKAKKRNIQESYSVTCSIFPGASSSCVGDADPSGDNNTKDAYMFAPKVLPITLSNFSGTVNNDRSNLSWTIDNESGVANYEVLRSLNGTDFESVGKVAANNSRKYSLADDIAGKGNKFYYRLKINGNSNDYSYSKIVVLTIDGNGKITVFPNPVKNVVNITSLKGTEMINIFGVDGRRMLEQRATTGNNTVDITKLARGTYNVVISNGAEVSNYKIVKVQ